MGNTNSKNDPENVVLAEDFEGLAKKALGAKVNVAVSGPSQVGKSTLINAVFGEKVSEVTDTGKPCTQDLAVRELKSLKLNIADTRGFERTNNSYTYSQLASFGPHIIWLVLSFHGSIEETDFEICEKFPQVPVVVIINKSMISGDVPNLLHNKGSEVAVNSGVMKKVDWILEIKRKKKYDNVRSIIPTRLKKETETELIDASFGVNTLISETIALLPTAVSVAFVESCDSFQNNKIGISVAIIFGHTAAAAGAAWIPLPVVDTIVITSIQAAMLMSLFACYGVIGKDAVAVIKSVLKGIGAAFIPLGVGFAISTFVGDFVKLIPGVGTVVGGAIDCVIASLFTLFLGVVVTVWINVTTLSKINAMTTAAMERSMSDFFQSPKLQTLLKEDVRGKSREELITNLEKVINEMQQQKDEPSQ